MERRLAATAIHTTSVLTVLAASVGGGLHFAFAGLALLMGHEFGAGDPEAVVPLYTAMGLLRLGPVAVVCAFLVYGAGLIGKGASGAWLIVTAVSAALAPIVGTLAALVLSPITCHVFILELPLNLLAIGVGMTACANVLRIAASQTAAAEQS